MTDRSDRVLLRYEIDEAALNRTIARANAARERISQMRGTFAQMAQAAKQSSDVVVTSNKRVLDSLYEEFKAYEKVHSAQKKVNTERTKTASASARSSVGTVSAGDSGLNALARTESAVSRTGGALRGLGLGGAGDVVSGAGDILQLVGSLGQLGPAAGIAAAGIAGFAIGLKIAEESSKDAKRALDAALSTQQNYYKALETLTTEQVIAEINVLERRRKVQQEATDESERALQLLEKQTGISRNVGIAAPGQLGDGFRQLTGQLDENKKAVAESDIAIGRYNGGLKSNAFAANDAAEAERKLSEARAKGFQEEIERRRRTDAITSQEQIDEQISSIQAQIDTNEQWMKTVPPITVVSNELLETYKKVAEETKKLKLELDALKNVLPSVFTRDPDFDDFGRGNTLEGENLEARQRETEMIIKSTAAMNDFADEAERLSEERNLAKSREGQDFSIKRARDQAEFTRRTAESDSAYYKDRGKKIAAFNREMADSDNEAQKARIKAVQEANDAQIRAAEDFARTVAGFTEQINDAGANLDAIGVRNAQRGLAAANDQYNLEKRRRDQDATKRIDEIVENAKAQKDARAAAFAEELADADAEHAVERQKAQEEFIRRTQQEDQDRQLRLQRQAEDYARQDQQRRAAFDKQIQNLQTQLLGPEEQAKVSSYGRQRQSLNDFLNGAENDVNAAKARISTVTTTTAPIRGPTPAATQPRVATVSSFTRGFAHGGRPPIGVPVMINEGRAEPVIFGSPAQVGGSAWGKSGSGVNIGDIYLNGGLAPEQYKAMVKQGIAEAFMEDMN